MRIRFNGGPWDGVEFEAPFCPDAIGFRHTDMRYDPVKGKLFAFKVHAAKRNHHQYLFDKPAVLEGVELKVGQNLAREPRDGEDLIELVDDSLVVMHYRYAPTEGPWWERPEE
jgi:hypothetical protein